MPVFDNLGQQIQLATDGQDYGVALTQGEWNSLQNNIVKIVLNPDVTVVDSRNESEVDFCSCTNCCPVVQDHGRTLGGFNGPSGVYGFIKDRASTGI